MVQHPFDNIKVRKCIEPLGNLKDTFHFFSRDIGMRIFLIFGDICLIVLKDMGYFFEQNNGIWDTGTPTSSVSSLFVIYEPRH